MPVSPKKTMKWHHPSEVMKLHKLKLKKKALQARITGETSKVKSKPTSKNAVLEDILSARKRKNPFVKDIQETKRYKPQEPLEESSDQTLFKLLHQSNTSTSVQSLNVSTFENILTTVNDKEVFVVKADGEKDPPIDWSLKTKIRLFSEQPFAWNQKLKLNEEASGTTGFVRCLDRSCTTNLDTSPNAKFYQCCMLWQQPCLPWLKLFPRTIGKASESGVSMATNATIKTSLQSAFSDSLRSLFQLIRTKQCPYFYLCANNFTVLFRAAGICGISEVHALITPTTRGFRHMLRQSDIEFTMPLKKKRMSDQGYDTIDSAMGESESGEFEEEEEAPDEQWLKSMGINAEDIKQINYTQAKIVQKAECRVDNSEQSLILVEGVEVHALYNFLINCKSATATTGPLAGIPPTLLAPVAFNGATLKALNVKESKVHLDNADFFSLEIIGPIMPSTIHNILSINAPEHSSSASFVNVPSTMSFNKVTKITDESKNGGGKGNIIFNKENLSDCGLSNEILELFCKPNVSIATVECLKYNSDSQTYTWT